jgi:hypothetical protein
MAVLARISAEALKPTAPVAQTLSVSSVSLLALGVKLPKKWTEYRSCP